MSAGHIIFLNGTSSAGKTTLAQTLQTMLEKPYLHIALDQFRDALPGRYRGLNSPDGTTGAEGLNIVPVHDEAGAHTDVRFGPVGLTMLRGMRRAIAALAAAGNNVIVDDLLLDPAFLTDYLEALEPFTVLFVGIRCSTDVINERERARPGRFPGTALGQFEIIHAHGLYDVEVDSAQSAPRECAQQVIDCLRSPPRPSAFEQLRVLHGTRGAR